MAFLSGVSCCASMIDVQLLICRSQSTSDLPVQLRHQSSSCALAGEVRRRATIRAEKSERTTIIMLQQLVPTMLAQVFNCRTGEFHEPQVWSGLGSARLFFRSLKARGCGAPEQTPEEDTRLSSAPPAFPAFAFHGARTHGGPIVADGVAPGSARGCSCEPHPQVPVPVPPSRRLMKAPLDGRDVCNLG